MSDAAAQPAPADRALRASVVIPVRGRADLLTKTLAALAAQTLPRETFEVIVVDDGTPEDEPAIGPAARAAAPGLNLRVLAQAPAGPAAARNRGIDAAAAPVIAFLDADVLPRPDWLERGLAAFIGDEPPAAVEGQTVVEPAAERTPFTHQTDNRDGGRYPTCNLFVDRLWIRDRGVRFDERYVMPFREDSDFAFQILASGGEIRWVPEAEVVHPPVPRGWTTALRLAARYEQDELLKQRFGWRYESLDRRMGMSHFRQRMYAALLMLEGFTLMVVLLAKRPVPMWFWAATFSMLLLHATIVTLLLCGGFRSNLRVVHFSAAFGVSLVLPIVWGCARLKGLSRHALGVEAFEGVDLARSETIS